MAIRSVLLRAHKSWQCLLNERDLGFSTGTKDLTFAAPKHRHYSSSKTKNCGGPITPIAEAKRFMKDCLEAVGTQSDHAEIVANNLLEADYRGHYSHGMNRLEMYIRDIQHGTTCANVQIELVKESLATALVDGKNGLGAVVGKRCMEIAICKAKKAGIGFVSARGNTECERSPLFWYIKKCVAVYSNDNRSFLEFPLPPMMFSMHYPRLRPFPMVFLFPSMVRWWSKARIVHREHHWRKRKFKEAAITNQNEDCIGSNHYGIAAIYGLQAIDEGLLGLSFSNTSPFMTPTRAKQCALGTNPLSLAAPGLEGDHFLLDMATTAVAVGKIELAKRKKEPIPPGWALNNEGIPETNPEIAFKAGKLMPLGGTEEHSGYKGYGLGMLVEIFCGLLSGSSFGPYIRTWGRSDEVANLGQAFMAIDPGAFEPGFSERLSNLMCFLRQMEPVDPKKAVLIHGDKERAHMSLVDEEGGLKYVENQHKTNTILAKELKVKPMISCDS